MKNIKKKNKTIAEYPEYQEDIRISIGVVCFFIPCVFDICNLTMLEMHSLLIRVVSLSEGFSLKGSYLTIKNKEPF